MSEHDQPIDPDEVRAVVQDAVDAASTAYAADASITVEDELRAELRSRGAELDDEQWLREAARHIRSGHPVVVGTGAPQDEVPPDVDPST